MNPFKRSKPWPSGHGAVTTKGATMGKGLREQGTSETEPVTGPESRPCNSMAHMALIGNYHGQIQTLTATVAERDATIERLWRELNEATNVPDAPTTSQLPVAPKLGVGDPRLVCPESCNGQSWTGVDQAEGPDKVWRCDTCGRIVSQSVSNPAWIQP